MNIKSTVVEFSYHLPVFHLSRSVAINFTTKVNRPLLLASSKQMPACRQTGLVTPKEFLGNKRSITLPACGQELKINQIFFIDLKKEETFICRQRGGQAQRSYFLYSF